MESPTRTSSSRSTAHTTCCPRGRSGSDTAGTHITLSMQAGIQLITNIMHRLASPCSQQRRHIHPRDSSHQNARELPSRAEATAAGTRARSHHLDPRRPGPRARTRSRNLHQSRRPLPMPSGTEFPPDTRSRTGILRKSPSCSLGAFLMPTPLANGSMIGLSTTMARPPPFRTWPARCGSS